MPLLKWDREDFGMMLPHGRSRRPLDSRDNETVAMHWDGTYRDRSAYSDGFWSDEDYANYGPRCTHPEIFAKHLA